MPVDAPPNRLAKTAPQGSDLVYIQAPGRSLGMESRPPQALIGVDVPDPRDSSLVEHRGLESSPSLREGSRKVRRRERAIERLEAEALVEVRVKLGLGNEGPRPKPSDIAIDEFCPVVEPDLGTPVWISISLDPALGKVAEAAGHSKVDEQPRISLECDDQVFPAPIERAHALARQRAHDRFRPLWTREPQVVDLDLLESATGEQRVELPSDRLDLGKLRHDYTPEDRRMSRTIGTGSGATVPMS